MVKYASFSNIQVFNCNYLQIHTDYNNIQYSQISTTVIDNEVIHKNFQVENNTVTNPFMEITSTSYRIQYSVFNNNLNYGDLVPTILISSLNEKVYIQNVNITNTKSYQGTTLSLRNVRNAYIQNSIFQNNTSQQKGGAIYSVYSNIYICNSKINNNQALIGGGIYYIGTKPFAKCLFDESQSDFNFRQNFQSSQRITNLDNQKDYINEKELLYEQIESNDAIFYGNDLGSELKKLEIVSFNLNENAKYSKVNDSYYEINNFRSGDILKITLQIKDEEGFPININYNYEEQFAYDVVDMIQNQKVEVVAYDSETVIQFDHYIVSTIKDYDYQTQTIQFNNPLQIIGSPNMTSKFNLIYLANNYKSDYYINDYMGVNDIQISITFKNCVEGEIQTKLEKQLIECIPCKEGTYSLENPSIGDVVKCTRCPESASQCYGNVINLKEGYWRSSDKSSNIIYCKNKPQNCIGSKEQNINYCDKGFVGPLCEACDSYGEVWGQKYMRRKNFSCEPCDQTNRYNFILPTVFLFIALILYIVFSVNTTIKMSQQFTYIHYFRKMGILSVGASALRNQTNFYIKQLMHYLQIIYYINTYEFSYPDLIQFIPDSISSPFQNIQFDFDCLLNKIGDNVLPIIFVRAVWTLIIPIGFLIILYLIYSLMVVLKIISRNRYYITNGVLFILLFMQPGILSDLISAISCTQVDSVSYVHSDKKYKCYTYDHIKFSSIIVLPGLLLWTFIIPIYTLQLLRKYKYNLDSIKARFLYGFLYQDYSKKYYYWEFIKSYKKILIVGFYNFFFDYPYTRLVLTSILMIIYNQLVYMLKPYQQIYSNKIDSFIVIILICILNMNILLKDNVVQWMYQLGFYFTAVAHNALILSLIIKIIFSKIESLYPKFLFYLQIRLKNKMPFIFYCLRPQQPVDPRRVQRNWKRVMKQISIIIQKRKTLIKVDNSNIELNSILKNKQQANAQQTKSTLQGSPNQGQLRESYYKRVSPKSKLNKPEVRFFSNKQMSNSASFQSLSHQSILPLNHQYLEDISKNNSVSQGEFSYQLEQNRNRFNKRLNFKGVSEIDLDKINQTIQIQSQKQQKIINLDSNSSQSNTSEQTSQPDIVSDDHRIQQLKVASKPNLQFNQTIPLQIIDLNNPQQFNFEKNATQNINLENYDPQINCLIANQQKVIELELQNEEQQFEQKNTQNKQILFSDSDIDESDKPK